MKQKLQFLLISICLITSATAQTKPHKSTGSVEQTSFGAEEKIRRRAKIPAAILKSLKTDERVKDCLAENDKSKGKFETWFSAAQVNLNGDAQSDFVVKPENACLFGANIVPFWVFRSGGGKYDLMVHAYSLSLEVLPIKTRGYRDIEIFAASATTGFGAKYKFDGKNYVPKSCYEQPLGESLREGRKKYISCSGSAEKPYR